MPLPIYFAPLEGVTDATFRRVHHAVFGGPTKYFIPFVSPTQNLTFTARELAAVAQAANAGVPAVPQVLTRNADHFLWAANALLDMGYGEVNLNMGCPSGTVTAKGKGAGMLTDIPALERFLDAVYARAPLPVSIKTRIGFASPAEFERLLPILSRYPVHELIVHPRTRREFYAGAPHREVFAAAQEQTRLPLIYNGDLFTAQDCRDAEAAFPGTRALMLGRGLVANPALARQRAGGEGLTTHELRRFLAELEDAYRAVYPANVVLGRMREVALHAICCFESPEKPRKALRKASSLPALGDALSGLLDAHALRENPGFTPAR